MATSVESFYDIQRENKRKRAGDSNSISHPPYRGIRGGDYGANAIVNGGSRRGYKFSPTGGVQQPPSAKDLLIYPVRPSTAFLNLRNAKTAMYAPGPDAAYAVPKWTMLFSVDDETPNGSLYGYARGSLAGLGADITAVEPNEIMQRELLAERISILGSFAGNTFSLRSDDPQDNIYVGVISVNFSLEDVVKPGDLIRWIPPLPSQVGRIPRDLTTNPAMVPLIPVPVRSAPLATHIERVTNFFILRGENSFGRILKTSYAGYHRWQRFAKYREQDALIHGLCMVSALMEYVGFTICEPDNPSPDGLSSKGSKNLRTVLLGSGPLHADTFQKNAIKEKKYPNFLGRLAAVLELTDFGATQMCENPATGKSYTNQLTRDELNSCRTFKDHLLKMMFNNGKDPVHFIGSIVKSGRPENIAVRGDRLDLDHPVGRLIDLQRTASSLMMQEMETIFLGETNRVCGRVQTVRKSAKTQDAHVNINTC